MKDDPENGAVLGILKSMFARHVAKEAPSVVNGYAPDQSTTSALTPALPPRQPQPEPLTADAIILRFELLLMHGPRSLKVLAYGTR